MTRVEININPQVLRWAREEAGYDPSEIADKVEIATDRYKSSFYPITNKQGQLALKFWQIFLD